MGAGAASGFDIPDRVDYETCRQLANEANERHNLKICIDKVRFDIMKRKEDDTITRVEAMVR